MILHTMNKFRNRSRQKTIYITLV